ncbi:MAG: ABC transporter permease [Armatimonadota bacterium]
MPVKALRIDLSLPVLAKEMRSRMRGGRAPVLLGVSTALTIAVGLLILFLNIDRYGVSDMHGMAEVGRWLFTGVLVTIATLAVLIAPALTAGCLTVEKEKQTLEGLFLTRLSCANIALGKLCSALGFLLLMILCALPVLAVSFLLGGVDPAQLAWAFGIIVATVLAVGAFGLYCSARFAKTATAVIVAYLGALFWLLAIFPFTVTFFLRFGNGPVYLASISALLFFIFSGLLMSLIPAFVLSALPSVLLRRPLSRVWWIVIWLLVAFTAGYLLVCNDFGRGLGNLNAIWLLAGNPLAGLGFVFFPEIANIAPFPLSIRLYFVPITLGLILTCAALTTIQAVYALCRLRDLPAPARRRKARQGPPPKMEGGMGDLPEGDLQEYYANW